MSLEEESSEAVMSLKLWADTEEEGLSVKFGERQQNNALILKTPTTLTWLGKGSVGEALGVQARTPEFESPEFK